MNKFKCKCGFETNNEERLVKHIFQECGLSDEIKNNEVKKYEYYRKLVNFAVDNVLKEIAEGVFEVKDCQIDEFRALWILLASGLVKDSLFNTTQEEAQKMLLLYAPEAMIAMLEFAKLVKVEFINNKLFVKRANS